MSLVRSVGALDFDSLPPGQERPRAGEVVGHAGQSEPGSIGVVGPVIRPGDNRGREIGRRRFSASDPQRHPSATPRSRQTAHETGRFARRHGVLIQANSRGSRHEGSVPSSQSAPINRPIESEKAEMADAPNHWTQRPTNAGTSSSAPSTYENSGGASPRDTTNSPLYTAQRQH